MAVSLLFSSIAAATATSMHKWRSYSNFTCTRYSHQNSIGSESVQHLSWST